MVLTLILNIGLLLLVFGATKKKVSPYLAALILGVAKGAITGLITHKLSIAINEGLGFWILAAAFVYFMLRLDRHEDAEREEVPNYSMAAAEQVKLRWEYLPLVIIFLLIAIG